MRHLLLILMIAFALQISAQTTETTGKQATWATMMQDPNANFYDIKKSFDAYWQGKDVQDKTVTKGKGYKVLNVGKTIWLPGFSQAEIW